MTLGGGGILSSEPADIVRRLTFATKEAAGKDHEDLFAAMARVNLAHVIMLSERKLVSPTVARSLAGLLLEIFEGGMKVVPLAPENGDLYPQIEAFAASRLGNDVAGFLQLGRSRGDVIPAAMRLKLRTKTLRLLAAQDTLRTALLDAGEAQLDKVMPAYTHWQQSQVMTVGHFLGRFAAWFARDNARLWECLDRHDFSPLGAANGVGTSVKLDRDITAALLGHRGPIASAGDAVNAWDYMIEPVQCAALFCANAARLMGNFILWHTQEFAMVRLSDAFNTASTYLPHKRNPEPLETVKAFAELVHGDLATVYLMARNEDWPHSLINHGFPAINRALDLSVDAALLSTAILKDIEFLGDRMRDHVHAGFATVSEVANMLVVRAEIPFREAHEIVGLAVRKCIAEKGKALTPAGVRAAARELGHGSLKVDDDDIVRSMDPQEFVRRMDSAGGASPAQLRIQYLAWRRQVLDDRGRITAKRQQYDSADHELVRRARRVAGL